MSKQGTTTFRGNPGERPYTVEIYVDGRLFYGDTLDAAASEEAVFLTWVVWALRLIHKMVDVGPPTPPPVAAPPGAEQLPLPGTDST
jgi:hypothetical protein